MNAEQINRTTDLAALAPGLRASGRYFSGPCPFCGGDDRFTIRRTDDGDLWHCRKCGGEKYEDAVAFLMRRYGRTFAEVVSGNDGARVTNDEPAARPPLAQSPNPPVPHPHDDQSPPPDEWQMPALLAIGACLDALYKTHAAADPDEATDRALAIGRYLQRSRGLRPETIWNAHLAYNPAWRKLDNGRWLAPGIVIPCMVDGELWYVKVRTTKEARAEAQRRGKSLGKYVALKGSVTRALYNANTLLRPRAGADGGRRVAVIVEGEFDALLLEQFLPPGWAAVTMGSAGALPGPAFTPYLAVARRVLLALDGDSAGQAGAAAWRQLFPGVELLPPLPDGSKDITDYWRAGGDLAAWVTGATNDG